MCDQLDELRLIQQAIGLGTNNFVANVPGREDALKFCAKSPQRLATLKTLNFGQNVGITTKLGNRISIKLCKIIQSATNLLNKH